MTYKRAIHESLPCRLEITKSARTGIVKWAEDEHAFFSMQQAFQVHIEKRPDNKQGNMSFTLFFDNETNETLAKRLDNRVAVMECVYKNDGFLVTGFHVRGRREPVRTNRRHHVGLKFHVGRSTGIAMPIELYTSLRELPIAEERSQYVEKRIASWEGYLRVEERNADVADVTATFAQASFNEDFSKLSLVCSGLQGKDWKAVIGFSAKMTGLHNDIGTVIQTNRAKRIVEIELSRHVRELARRNEFHPKQYKEIVFSNFAELSQVKRLRKGFKDLQDGFAANANLEKILFEERPVVRISKKKQDLVFHNELNKFQKEAVTGAMTSNDLYVIQGPPGTGKTTVISEICHQNVKAGLRTLVASQANLAVDNALSRLLSHQDIRILRYGRTESIEEEGKRFIEENVALNWKNETLTAVKEHIQSNKQSEAQLTTELRHCEAEIEKLQNELLLLDEQVRLKDVAQAKHLVHAAELAKLTKKDLLLTNKRKDLLESEAVLKKSAGELAEGILRLEQRIQAESISVDTVEQMEAVQLDITRFRAKIKYLQTEQKCEEIKRTLAGSQKEVDMKKSVLTDLQTFLTEIESITKMDELKSKMDYFGLVVPTHLNSKIRELEELIEQIKSATSTNDYREWKDLNERLSTAIDKLTLLLKDNGFLKQTVKRNGNQKYNTVEEIHGLIDRVGRFLVEPSTKQTLESRNYSAQKYDNLEKLAIALEILRERRSYTNAQGADLEKYNQMIGNSRKVFLSIKTAVVEHVNQSIMALERESNEMSGDSEEQESMLQNLQDTMSAQRAQFGEFDETKRIESLTEKLTNAERTVAGYEEKQVALNEYAIDLENGNNVAEKTTQELKEKGVALQDVTEETDLIKEQLLEQEQEIAALAEILAQHPEEQREQALTSYYTLSKNAEQLTIDKERLPITHALQQEWLTLLTEANDYDLDEIRKLYVQHANVIGTTCVASARRDFMEEYPTFDVVIIDEVSKATPPELLLPMLKGKKVILVGDHHQLPPLMGQATLEELLEESAHPEEKKELEKLLKESLFERLFRTLPVQNKTMLGIQYRMHESIMETITPFYEEGNYSLQCGLVDSDTVRDHLIDSRYIERKDHLLWFDMPNEPKFFEERVKGGTSRFNQAELDMTRKLLIDLNQATEQAKKEGILKWEDKKSVGVISFYGEQVKRIDRLIQQELMPEHLHCRTGSVDKFQGMEMDVIILSFVRNHNNKSGDIGFARDYRRLNVALSRARELLIIVGSSEMFTVRAKHPSTKEMYGRLLEGIKMKNGLRDYDGKVK